MRKAVCQYAHQDFFGTSLRFLNCTHGNNCFPSFPTVDGRHQPPSVCGKKSRKLRSQQPQSSPQRVDRRLSTYQPPISVDVPLELRINGLFPLLIDGVYWGYNPLTNLLLTSWDIQVTYPPKKIAGLIIRAYENRLVSLNSWPAINPLFLGE